MAYDTTLAERIDLLSLNWPGIGTKKMFGGLGYLLHDNMAFGIWKDQLIVRCGPESHARCLGQPGVREFDITGRPMAGWVMVAPEGFETEAALLAWLERGRDFAATLPPK
ncbi:MAG: TfoX/Sxy family protein [Betaproteobacteria bacterium]|nr:TfoX/Sxy family protein [Betaproteobacteria bacterium]